MTQARSKFTTFEEYLSASDTLEGRYELIEGELVELSPESEPNNWIARYLLISLAASGIISPRLIVIHSLELQVPVLQPRDPANRFPDFVILRAEHLELTQRRLTITLDMPPPQLIAEVISPGKTNRERDLIYKRAQYAAIALPEYWLIDPGTKSITVLYLQDDDYDEIGTFKGDECVNSPTLPMLMLTAEQIFADQL
jgi:Uma2 family endonuclease